jgi:hypothetical protein
MTSKKIIERLKSADWYIVCKTDHELALVLNACLDADIRWLSGESITEYAPLLCTDASLFIGKQSQYHAERIGHGEVCRKETEITDWFFEELRNEHEQNTD